MLKKFVYALILFVGPIGGLANPSYFAFSQKNSPEKPIRDKIANLEKRIERIEKSLQNLTMCLKTLSLPQNSKTAEEAIDKALAHDSMHNKDNFQKKVETKREPLSRDLTAVKHGPFAEKPLQPKSSNTKPADSLKFEEARKYLEEGNIAKATQLFKKLTEFPNSEHYADAFYWLGIISLYQDNAPEKASNYFSQAYQAKKGKGDASEGKSLFFEKSVLLKLAYSLKECSEIHKAKIVLKEFFTLPKAKNLSDQQLSREAQLLSRELGILK